MLWCDDLRRDERAQDLVEYALMASLVALGIAFFVPDLSASMDVIYSRVSSKLVEAAG